MTDPKCDSKSHKDYANGFLLSHKAMIWFWEQLQESSVNLSDPVFNLTIDPKVKLPGTIIITAGFDPLSDEGEAYARLLNNFSNDVQQIHYPHLIHGFVNMTSLKAARAATKDLIEVPASFKPIFPLARSDSTKYCNCSDVLDYILLRTTVFST